MLYSTVIKVVNSNYDGGNSDLMLAQIVYCTLYSVQYSTVQCTVHLYTYSSIIPTLCNILYYSVP